MSRTPYGDGSVFQRASDQQWVANYTYEGKRRATYGKTRAEAVRKRRAAKDRLAKGMAARDARRTFHQEATRWIDITSHALNLTAAPPDDGQRVSCITTDFAGRPLSLTVEY